MTPPPITPLTLEELTNAAWDAPEDTPIKVMGSIVTGVKYFDEEPREIQLYVAPPLRELEDGKGPADAGRAHEQG